MFVIGKNVYNVHMEFINEKICIVMIASKMSCLYLETENVL